MDSLPKGMVCMLTTDQALRRRKERVAVVQREPLCVVRAIESTNTNVCEDTRAQ